MIDKLINIENFNIYSDDEYYYFFRALEELDLDGIEKKKIVDSNGNITRLMTDREYYGEKDKFHSDSEISLDEVFSHIKMHYDRHTNCISFTSNANTVLTYGRQDYEDKYVIFKVPRKDFGKDTIFAPNYMLKEVENKINDYVINSELDDFQKFYLSAIDNATSLEELERIKLSLPKEYAKTSVDFFEEGITFNGNVTDSINYQTLNDEQNLLKNKIILKMDVINQKFLPNASNKFLIQTIGSSFASQEVINYKDVPGDKLINVSKEMMDVLSLVQHLPKDDEQVIELKRLLINHINNNQNKTYDRFERENSYLKGDITIESMYRLTNGNIPYGEASRLYKKAFYIAKSKLRCLNSCKLLEKITNNDPKYKELIEYIRQNCYGIEPEITTRLNKRGMQLSEGVNLFVTNRELELVNRLSNLNEDKLKYILDNPLSVVQEFLKDSTYVRPIHMNEEEYYANSIIDLFDWESLGITINFSSSQRQDIIDKLIESNFISIYNDLKKQNIKEKDIANILLTTIIKNKDINNIDKYDTFTVQELEYFIGYNRVKGTTLKLRNYQRMAFDNINKNFENRRYTTAVLPTGAGKSFVALAQMYNHRNDTENEGILYLAPNVEILRQLKAYIWDYYADKSLTKSEDELINEVFPGLVLSTYTYLDSPNANGIINHKYNMIVCDELHRTGAVVSNSNIDRLFKNQSESTKILGITATPLRDADSKNMAKYWARYFDYTDEEIITNKHLSINMDLYEAIERGFVVNPKLVSCEYNLLKDGHMESLLEKIESIRSEEEIKEKKKEYEELRRRLESAKGISDIFNDNIKVGGKYIVFCPVRNQKGQILENEDGKVIDKTSANIYMKQYMDNLKQELELFAENNGLSFDTDIEITSMLGSYSDKDNETNLDNFNKTEPNKTKFIVVMNKLNEGVHVNNIDGIIWKRPLSEKSRILYLQQLGRCIYGLDPNKEYLDDSRPTVIDLVNNTMNVILDKEESSLQRYLDKVSNIVEWYNNNDKMPNLNSFDIDECKLGNSAKDIQTKFKMYLNNEELFKPLSNEDKIIIEEILNLGIQIDLWDFDFDPRDKISIEEKLSIYIDMLNNNYEPHYYDKYTNFKGTSIQINQFLKSNINILIIPKLFFDLKEDTNYDNARSNLLNFLGVNTIEEYLNKLNTQDMFKLTGLLKDFHEFEEKVDEASSFTWNDWYELAEEYYKHYGNLEVPQRFKTLNGYEKDENGLVLGHWITNQRSAYNGKGTTKITPLQIELLEKIGMRFEVKNNEEKWNKMYRLAKAYYERYGDIEVPYSFKTLNGYEKDENGLALGHWITNQRNAYNGKGTTKITPLQIELLEKIGMRFEIKNNKISWDNWYELAKAYYEHKGDLEVPVRFKTLNGYDEDENGLGLGYWIYTQKSIYNGKDTTKITPLQIELLEKIGMRFGVKNNEEKWNKMYRLAKAYYEHKGDLEVPARFKTLNGYDEDENGLGLGYWIFRQRRGYYGKGNANRITPLQIKLLEDIGMKWFDDKVDDKLQKEEIIEKNKFKKEKEVLNRFYTLLNNYDNKDLPSKENINDDFIDKLNRKM